MVSDELVAARGSTTSARSCIARCTTRARGAPAEQDTRRARATRRRSRAARRLACRHRSVGHRDAVQRGLTPLIFKGAALGHRHYAEPWLRPRVDTDLLFAERERSAAAAAFGQMGFTLAPRPTGEHVTHQCTYVRLAHGMRAEYDSTGRSRTRRSSRRAVVRRARPAMLCGAQLGSAARSISTSTR